jgi:hypothetical protein
MSDLIELTDTEIELVSGGAVAVAVQRIDQFALALAVASGINGKKHNKGHGGNAEAVNVIGVANNIAVA